MEFHEAVGDGDYALILGNEGELKGLWIPLGKRELDIPEAIVKICINYYGIDPRDEYSKPTMH